MRAKKSGALVAALGLALAFALTACGGGAREVRKPASARSRPAPTHAQAAAFASAVNLKPADVPGFAPSPHRQSESSHERSLQVQLQRCAGPLPSGGDVLEAQSPAFKLKQDVIDLSVSSEVAVSRTGTLAARALAALNAPRVRRCFSRYLNLLLASERYSGAVPKPVSILTGTPPAPGASASFGWRVTASFALKGATVSLYSDILGFVLGPARVTLVSSGALRPFPAAIQQRLYSLLLARARAGAL
ncbi:MAG TPA: hypothetical protein VGX51_02610 [Solirubrobacteraceae bacterium]|jgi:hypothetical protein|nr:hypothetical protein [Solirubrobacteraceae bacterium]